MAYERKRVLKHKILLVIGRMWIVFGLSIIFLDYFQVFQDGGWSELGNKIQNFDPRNIIGYLILLSPGFVFLWWAKKYED